METHYAEPIGKIKADLPILKHLDMGQLPATISDPLKSFRKGERPIYNIAKLLALGTVGYFSWVYVLPPLFQMAGRVLAIGGAIALIIAMVLFAPVFLKILRRGVRRAHELAITHDPFGELYEQKDTMVENKKKFVMSQGKINKLGQDTRIEASKAEELAKTLQGNIVSAKKKIDKLKARQEELGKTSEGKTSPEYIQNYADLIKLSASVQRDISQKEQQVNFVRKYGVRSQTIQKLSNKLVLVGAQMDIKILDFDATIDILKREFEFAKEARHATQTAKDALMSTEGWEVEYAMDVVTTAIAQDIAMTASNISDINNYTTLYDMDDDRLYAKLDALAEDIVTGNDIVPSAKEYNNPDYKLTHEDQLQTGNFGGLF